MISTSKRVLVLLITLASCWAVGFAQGKTLVPGTDSIEWKEFSSPAGRFSILFPETPVENNDPIETKVGKVPTHTVTVFREANFFLVLYADLPTTALDAEGVKQMLDAGRDRMLAADSNMKLVSEKDISLGVYTGREIVAHDNDSVTRARAYIVNDRLYQIVFATKAENALKTAGNFAVRTEVFETTASRFLDSFKLLADAATLGEVDRMSLELANKKQGILTMVGSAEPVPENIITGGVINSRAEHLVSPAYPPIARAAHAAGAVSVKVIIDLEGKVVAAQAVDGHPLLRAAAVRAARESKFSPTQLEGKPVMVLGIIIYNFVSQ